MTEVVDVAGQSGFLNKILELEDHWLSTVQSVLVSACCFSIGWQEPCTLFP